MITPEVATEANRELHADNRNFRRVLTAMSRPGLTVGLEALEPYEAALPASMAAVARCLLDSQTPVWIDKALDSPSALEYLELTCGVQVMGRLRDASFALIGEPLEMPPLSAFNQGEQNYPDRSATLLLKISSLSGGPAVRVAGPGIETTVTVEPQGLPAWFWSAWDENGRSYPLGVDVLLLDQKSMLGLPRTTRKV